VNGNLEGQLSNLAGLSTFNFRENKRGKKTAKEKLHSDRAAPIEEMKVENGGSPSCCKCGWGKEN
jgi:hypothetical protein